MPLEAVESRRLYRQVADQLRQAMDRGDFQIGARLPTERALAEKLCVSRPTVREALIALEVEGRVRIRVGSGIYVTPPPTPARVDADPAGRGRAEGPFELLRAREFIEGAVAEEAARQASADDIAALDVVIAAMAGETHPADNNIRHDREFHVRIAAILDNSVLSRVVGELFDERINPYFRQLAGYFENDATWREAYAEHRVIRDAIAARDPAAARAAMRAHLQRSQDRFSRSFEDVPRSTPADP